MSASNIIDGKAFAATVRAQVAEHVARLKEEHVSRTKEIFRSVHVEDCP